jgi:hypothetical protein
MTSGTRDSRECLDALATLDLRDARVCLALPGQIVKSPIERLAQCADGESHGGGSQFSLQGFPGSQGKIMASRKVQTISVSRLISSVDKAVAQAARSKGVTLEGRTLITRWEIIGRILNERVEFDEAFSLATQITKAANVQGLKVQPAAGRFGGNILIGFVARDALLSLES